MKYIDVGSCEICGEAHVAGAPVIYVIDSPEHPFDLAGMTRARMCALAKIPVRSWNDSLTPWRAAGIYRGEPDFSGEAAITLGELVDEALPAIERAAGLRPVKRAICGYSLGGLFALYAFTHSGAFQACACLSGSVWYEGWVDYLRALDFDGAGRFVFLSIGSKEKHAAPKILHHVQDNMQSCADILQERDCIVEYVVGPGGHLSKVPERFEAGLTALERALS